MKQGDYGVKTTVQIGDQGFDVEVTTDDPKKIPKLIETVAQFCQDKHENT